MKFILVRTDGYSIEETGRYPNHHDAHEVMRNDYKELKERKVINNV